jgi:predicted acyltransferase
MADEVAATASYDGEPSAWNTNILGEAAPADLVDAIGHQFSRVLRTCRQRNFNAGVATIFIEPMSSLSCDAARPHIASVLLQNRGNDVSAWIVGEVELRIDQEGGYWVLMTCVPMPGVGAGSYAMDANLANWIDVNYLPGMQWDVSRDQEGLLSTLPAIGSCLLGVFAGILVQERSVRPRQKPLWLIGAGMPMVGAGYLWALQFPIIKQIWTSSFVLVAGGYSAILLGVFYQIIDVWEWRRWSTVFVWIGTNAIALYMLANVMNYHETVATRFVGGDVADFFDSHVTPGTGHLLAAAGGLALAICAANYLYRNKISLRV